MRHLNSGFNDNLDHLEFDAMVSDGQAVVVGTTTAARAFRQRGGGPGRARYFPAARARCRGSCETQMADDSYD